MTWAGFNPRVQGIIGRNREEIGNAVREIGRNRDKLFELLEGKNINAEVVSGYSLETSNEIQYLAELFDAYSDSGSRLEDKRRRIGLFAENYQQNPENVFEILRFFGLEI